MNKVVVVGGGFSGMWAAIAAAREASQLGEELEVTLVSKDEYLTVRPRLYEANPSALREPLKPVLDAIGARFVEAEISAIDAARHVVSADSGKEVPYDRLVLASGSTMTGLTIEGAQSCTFDVDSFEGALALDHHLQSLAQGADDNDAILIVGSGFTGVEIATEMRSRLAGHGDDAFASKMRIVLIERAPEIAPELGSNPRPDIIAALDEAGIERRTGASVVWVEGGEAVLSDGTRIATRTIIAAVGLRANALTETLNFERDNLGRLIVDDTLRVIGSSSIFATGDVARAKVDDRRVALMSCQHAMTMGKFAGMNAVRDLTGVSLVAYRQPQYVTCLDLGGAGALFTEGWERKVVKTGEEAKALKRQINTEWIYPPAGGKEALFKAAVVEQLVGS